MAEKNKSEGQEQLITHLPSPKQEHHVYHEWYLDSRAGGPPGYLANLLLGYNRIAYFDNPLIVFNSYKGKAPQQKKAQPKGLTGMIKKVAFSVPGGSTFYKKHISRSQKQSFENMYAFLINIDGMMPDEALISTIDWCKTKTIHVHTAPDVVKVKNYLRKNFLDNVKVILTCHTPESIAKEQYALSIADGQDETRAAKLRDLWLMLEKRGYQEADIMIFPSEEAMDPLMHDIDNFAEIVVDKDIRFMATGTIGLKSSLTKEEAKKKYGVSGKTVVGYIGRHNQIKGYDLLKEAAAIVMNNMKDVVFLIGGAQGTEFNPLDDPRWIEAGWVNPADMLQAVDVFVLPNRQTYYDLVLLEVLSMGVPVVATATGGNVSVKKIADDLELCEVDAKSMALAIEKIVQMDHSLREEMGRRLKAVYQNYFTEKHMAQRYVETIQRIYDDYNLWGKEQEEEK